MITHPITVGDTLTPVGATIKQPNTSGVLTVVDLTGLVVKFRMVSAAGAVIVDNADATIVDAESGLVQYDFASADVARPGTYYGWFIVFNAGETEKDTYPRDGRSFRIEISAAA